MELPNGMEIHDQRWGVDFMEPDIVQSLIMMKCMSVEGSRKIIQPKIIKARNYLKMCCNEFLCEKIHLQHKGCFEMSSNLPIPSAFQQISFSIR